MHAHMDLHARTHTCSPTCMITHMHALTHMYAFTHTCILSHTCMLTHTCPLIQTCMFTHMHAHTIYPLTHKCILTHMYAHTDIHALTHMYAFKLERDCNSRQELGTRACSHTHASSHMYMHAHTHTMHCIVYFQVQLCKYLQSSTQQWPNFCSLRIFL